MNEKINFEQKDNTMNILVAVNEVYLEPLSVMLYSLKIHNPVLLNVFILHLEISQESQNTFINQLKRWGRRINVYFVKVDKSYIKENIAYARYGMEAVLRLALLKVLPIDMDRILWIDTDVIIKGNIQKLYSYIDHGQYAVVCEDMLPKQEKYELMLQIGMKMSDRYFNSGIILFYLKNIRKDFRENTFFQWMYENTGKLKYPDQNTLNVCFKGNLSWAKPEIYNLQLLRVSPTMRYSKVIEKSKVLHFNTQKKPWNNDYDGEGEKEFWRYGIKILGIKRFLKHYIKL